ncbi:unnamed protein product [Miscanthus lutarioriparius]|uniref:KIB1-4 beta-propeller domain-containing protein n=1 Tax=Miscanthus lutarioriparius TaxID=422564 RepID=A0A811NXV7_9POAL|nr:unnamed protein product [Miscanthus lutarioriparius]
MESKLTQDVGPLAAAASSFPMLVYDYEHGNPPEISQTVLSVSDGSMRTIRVPEMCDYTCLETQQGLMLMVDTASGSCWLWNPQTGEKTALPSMNGELPYQCRCLISDTTSSPPDSVSDDVDPPDSLVLVYDLTRPELLFCRIRRRRRGAFYYSESRDVIGALFSFADDPEPRLELVTFDAPLPTLAVDAPQLKATKSYLLESSRELFLVCLFYISSSIERIEEVGAYVMDFSKKEWCKVTDIGDAAFLLGPGPGCFAASCSAAEHGLKSGCVYLADDNNDLHIFDLKQGTRELVRPTQDIPSLSRVPFWLVPGARPPAEPELFQVSYRD